MKQFNQQKLAGYLLFEIYLVEETFTEWLSHDCSLELKGSIEDYPKFWCALYLLIANLQWIVVTHPSKGF